MRFFSKPKKTGLLAICSLGNMTSVAYVLKRSSEKPFVMLCEIRPENLKDNASTEVLASELALSSKHCSLLLTQGEYQLLQIEKPNVPENELKKAVVWKVKDMIDYPIDQATIDVIEIPNDPHNARRVANVYVAVSNNATIGAYIDRTITHAGANLEFIDIPELAQRNLAAYLEQEGRGIVMLSVNDDGCLLTFTANGELFYARNIEVDSNQLATEDSEKKSNLLDRLSLEIQRSLDNFERMYPFVVINRLVLAPFMERENLLDYLKTTLYIQIERFDLDQIFNFDNGVDLGDLSMQANLLPVLGAALRGESAS